MKTNKAPAAGTAPGRAHNAYDGGTHAEEGCTEGTDIPRATPLPIPRHALKHTASPLSRTREHDTQPHPTPDPPPRAPFHEVWPSFPSSAPTDAPHWACRERVCDEQNMCVRGVAIAWVGMGWRMRTSKRQTAAPTRRRAHNPYDGVTHAGEGREADADSWKAAGPLPPHPSPPTIAQSQHRSPQRQTSDTPHSPCTATRTVANVAVVLSGCRVSCCDRLGVPTKRLCGETHVCREVRG